MSISLILHDNINLKGKPMELAILSGLQQHTLASAAGLTLPFTKKAPPRITICPIFFGNSGSFSMACNKTDDNFAALNKYQEHRINDDPDQKKLTRAILVSGPRATTVTSPGNWLAFSTRNVAADSSMAFPFGGGKFWFPSPSEP